jgi:hypothetical protein
MGEVSLSCRLQSFPVGGEAQITARCTSLKFFGEAEDQERWRGRPTGRRRQVARASPAAQLLRHPVQAVAV